MAAKPSRRFWVSWMGEYYMDCLEVEANLKSRTLAAEAASLLGSKLMEREEKRVKMVQYLAKKHGITYEDMWQQLRDGDYKPTDEEIEELEKDG